MMKQKEVWLADLEDHSLDGRRSSIQFGKRPVIIMQTDPLNDDPEVTTVIIVPLTSKTKKKMPTHLIIEDYKKYGLKSISTVLCEQSSSIQKTALIRKIAEIDDEIYFKVLDLIWRNLNKDFDNPTPFPF